MKEEFNLIIEKHKVLLDKAIEIMKQVKDIRHSLLHMESVVNYTMEILEHENKVNKEVCIISAYWHDVGRMVQEKDHALMSCKMLKEAMEELRYDKKLIDQCYLAICKHSFNEMPETLEGIIVRDADKIDFVGIGRWKQSIKEKKRFGNILKNLPMVRNEILQLEISKKIYDREVVNLIHYLHDVIFDGEEKGENNGY